MSTTRIPIAIRIPPEQLDQIDQHAAEHQLSRTSYMIAASTGELPHTTIDAITRIEALETAVKRLQDYAFNA